MHIEAYSPESLAPARPADQVGVAQPWRTVAGSPTRRVEPSLGQMADQAMRWFVVAVLNRLPVALGAACTVWLVIAAAYLLA